MLPHPFLALCARLGGLGAVSGALLVTAGTRMSLQEPQDEPTPAVRSAPQEAGFQEASAPRLPAYRFEPGPEIPYVEIPRDELLVYDAYVDFAVVNGHVGQVRQHCSVKEQARPLLLAGDAPPAGEIASIQLDAKGSYFGFGLESKLTTSILPQEWPHVRYEQSSKSSNKPERRREILLGLQEGNTTSSYRGDTSKGAAPGIRIWKQEEVRAVPAGTVDMLTAVFMARALVREGSPSIAFPLVDGARLWRLVLKRGQERRMRTGAGEFDVVEVVLAPEPYPGEDFDEKAKKFEGVFGIQGSMHLWVERHTGIAVRIQGDLPIGDGLITLGVDVLLASYSGTPEGFAPVPREPAGEDR